MKLPNRRQLLRVAAGSIALPAVSRLARADAYPSRRVRVIVPSAAGGQVDVVARLIGQRLSDQLGQQFYVENMPGAGTNIGTGRAAQMAPDGYTVFLTDGIGFTANPSLYGKVPYDPVRDFMPVTVAANTMQVLSVNPSVPALTIQELVALINSNPGQYSYGSAGIGTGSHLTGEMFRISLGLDLMHVPYGGGGPAIMATVGGHTPIALGAPSATIPQVKDGRLRALAVGGTTRVRGLPDVPTMREAGYTDVVCDSWVPVLVPAGTPKDVVALLHREIGRSVRDTQARLVELGFEPAESTPDELAALIKSEISKWAGVIRAAGIKAT
jgi:tripartite-type tricarboxylate transporter receptor subunit TctC